MLDEGEQADLSTSPRSGVKLFLGGLSWETTEDKIKEHFQQYGEIEGVIVMREAVTKKPRGFGFITFRDTEVADRVCSSTHILDGRQIDAKHSVPQENKPKSKKIFVGGLAPDTLEADFQAYFENFGKIADAQIMQDHLSGRSRGFGFVTFEDDSAVENVFAHGTMHEVQGKRVEVKVATPRGSGSIGGRSTSSAGRGLGRGVFPGRGSGFEGDDPSQTGFSMPYVPGYTGMIPGYQLQYNPYYHGGMMIGPYAQYYAQGFHPGYQIPQGFDPRHYQPQQTGRGYPALTNRPATSQLPHQRPPQ